MTDPASPWRPLFDARWYAAQAGLDLATSHEVYEHFRTIGRALGIPPGPLADRRVRLRAPLLEDWLIVERSGLFDAGWYAYVYRLPQDRALDDYLRDGAQVGCEPNPFFSGIGYLEDDDELLRTGVNPLVHYITHSLGERRNAALHPAFEKGFELHERAWRFGWF